MKRRLIQLTDTQEEQLVKLSKETGNSVAAHIRTAINMYLRLQPLPLIDENGYIRQGSGLPHDIHDWVVARDQFTCQECGRQGKPGLGPEDLQVHHKRPRRGGGSHSPDNLITLCTTCHKLADRRRFLESMRENQIKRGLKNPTDVEAALAAGPKTPPRRKTTNVAPS